MDHLPLLPITDALAQTDALGAFAAELPATSARVSEPALPLLLAALHRRLGRGLVCLLPDDEDARDAAEAAAWFGGSDSVAFMPGRGVTRESGLAPPPHLVGERHRALSVLASRGLVCMSAAAAAESLPAHHERPEPVDIEVGSPRGLDALTEELVLAGYERVERAEARGQLAVRGGILDVFGTTGREPLRVEFFGDVVEGIRAFSPFTQRALYELDRARIYPATERRADLQAEPEAAGGAVGAAAWEVDLVWRPDEVAEVWREDLGVDLELRGARLDPLPRGQRHSFEAQKPALAARGLAEAERELSALARSGLRVVVAFPRRGDALRTQHLLRRVEAGFLDPEGPLPEDGSVLFAVSPARSGLVWRDLGLALVPEAHVFRRRAPRPARVARALRSFADLRTGDYVVHEDHGVGQLLGFETKTVGGITRDYLLLAFRGEDRLYVPHDQVGKVSRYVGADGRPPALSKLGGRAWQLVKTRAGHAVRELAGELLALYAQREHAVGASFDLSGDWLERLEASFPYRETPDQLEAIEAVKEDLESSRPMDRLVCGDVGFGKTEIAVRAAFAVALNGKQTLVLAPTTVLAQQHWSTFRERFGDFPVATEMASRFRSAADVKLALADFAAGKVDVLIGTHRILSRDVVPSDLGLVVVDEEQRFGVAQKELLRQLRLEVDVLSLTATPIPRTLHMSLAGLRDISMIETPPEGRRPIRTYVGEYDEELVKHALEREAERGGQSFYLHNRVETIDEAAAKLAELCPSLRLLVAHGQMPERDLEERMMRFLRGDADVLVSTTIIESGLDIPQANTLVVERADLLGLAQLYQIRGRVGRSDVPAHAYLLYPDATELSEEARARLSTLADHTELGAGFAIAMRDLEIRGAGELLGREQSGHVAAVGFELYVDLLNEAVAELAGGRRTVPRPVRIDARVDAYVPAGYVSSEALKIDLHRRLALTASEDELRELHAEVSDRYGAPPEPVENLFALQEVRLKLAELGADYAVFRNGRLTLGPVLLGAEDVRDVRASVASAAYSNDRRELTLRSDGFREGLPLLAAILDVRRAA
ncbi:MAG TPA: transcription-repair coupling factor [Gaiellaceae bacterium]|nr:transcription-repair coupling factor [Gaiellaceae bacterium]